MFRSSMLSAVVVCAAGLLAPSVASAQMKVAVVNFQRAITETAEIKKAQNELQAKYKSQQDAIEKIQRELSDIQTQLQSSQGKLSAAGEADLQARGARRQREAQRMTDDLQADVDRDRNDIIQRATARMTEVVKKIADEKGFDMVLESSTMLSFKPALEITSEVISAYDKAYPVK